MKLRLVHLALLLCLFAGEFTSANAQPPYRRILLTDPSINPLQLRQLIMNYLTPGVVNLHLTPNIHNRNQFFLDWHRTYIAGLEAWLMTQPNGSKYVPLPKYDPIGAMPADFFSPAAVVSGFGNLAIQNPMIDLSPYLTNPCQYTGDQFGDYITTPHDNVHVTINGAMGSVNTASGAAIFWPWHAFLDDMYQYYRCVCQGATPKDLYIKDDVKDVGDEPNTTAPNNVYNGSPDIWVRDNADIYDATTQKYATEDDPGHHQNPTPGSVDYVYTRIRNNGCDRVLDGEMVLHVYWSPFSLGAACWPTDWTEICTVAVPALDPGKQWVAECQWSVPREHQRYCLLARLVPANPPTPDPIGPEVCNTIDNARNYNNVAMRNVDVVPFDPNTCTPTGPCNPVRITRSYEGPDSEYGYDRIRFDYTYNDQYKYNPVYIEVDLGQDLYYAWRDGGYKGEGIEDGPTDDYKVRITQPGAYLDDVYLDPGVTYEPCVQTYITNPDEGGYGGYGGYDGYGGGAGYPGYGGGSYGGYGTYGGVYPVNITQYETYEQQDYTIVGGATYEVRAERDYAALPDAKLITEYSITRPECPESYDGAIRQTIYQEPAGGGDYTYYWSNGATTRDIYELGPGTYNVVVRDNTNCTMQSQDYVVESYSTLAIEMDATLSRCGVGGEARCAVTGGVLPYGYTWYRDGTLLPGETGPTVKNAPKGEYSVIVRDNSPTRCSITGYVQVWDEWNMLTAEVVYTDASGPNSPDGTARAVAVGMPDLVYEWSTGATTPEIAGLLPGDYWVQVTDMSGAGCTIQRDFTIGYRQGQVNSVDRGSTAVAGVALVPNPTSNTTELRYRQQRAGFVQIELYDNLGRRVDLLYSGYVAIGDQVLPIATDGIASGQYTVSIRSSGMVTTTSLTVVH